jgi:hypothetical protein
VTKQDCHGIESCGSFVECTISRDSGGGLWPARSANIHGFDFDWFEPKGNQFVLSRFGNLGRTGLHLVVNHNCANSDAGPRALERSGCGERKRIWSA